MFIKTLLAKLSRLTLLSKRIKIIAITFLSVLLFWLACIHWTGIHQVAIKRNIVTGKVEIDSIAGINVTLPWIQVARIDIRPHRVCIECSCRALSCRLVEFNPKHWDEFLEKEGFKYYWLSNRISFNLGADQEYRGIDWILRGYAYDTNEHNFLKISKK
jgi:hypothetical protein